MKSGDIVKFTTSVYQDCWGLGLIIENANIVDRDGRLHPEFFRVLTQEGIKVVAGCFMEIINELR